MDDNTADVAFDLLQVLFYAGIGFLAGAALSIFIGVLFRLVLRRHPQLSPFDKRLKTPLRSALTIVGIGFGVIIAAGWPRPSKAEDSLRAILEHAFVIVLIFSLALLLTGLISAFHDFVIAKRAASEETVHARRLRTQAQVIGRVGKALVWLLAVAGALLTFQELRAVGASLLASAGLLSIVAGLAAQSTLANIFAGIQLAFTDALRVGDIVIVDTHWGFVEEITLTYVVVRSWDGRRWIVPSTVCVSKTFENWTRQDPELLGTVLFHLDWMVPIEAMRIELQRIVQHSDLWDGRAVTLQVTDALGPVEVRATVSAATPGDLWDLRCFVREELIVWLQDNAPYAFSRTRIEPETTTAPPRAVRKAFLDELEQQWSEEKAELPDEEERCQEEEGAEEPPAPEARSWLQALRDRRAANRELRNWQPSHQPPNLEDLISNVLRSEDQAPVTVSDIDGDETLLIPHRLERTDGRGDSLSSSARIFSGTPAADERNRQMAGPSAKDQAERKEKAEQSHALPKTSDGGDS